MEGRQFHVFFSYSTKDHDVVHELATRLQRDGFEVWLDTQQLRAGTGWEKKLQDALQRCDSCAVLVGPSGISDWQGMEAGVAVDRAVKEGPERFRVIPVLLPNGSLDKLTPFLRQYQVIDFTESLENTREYEELKKAIPRQPPPSSSERPPYPGLACFEEADAAVFFGREALISKALDQIETCMSAQGEPARFLSLVGCSGSGKSSLARAGIIASMRKGDLRSRPPWKIAVCRPLSDPMAELYVAIAAMFGEDPSAKAIREFAEELQRDPKALSRELRLRLAKEPPACRVLLLVDQFEECFTLTREEMVRHALIANLTHAAAEPGLPVLIMITLRADEFGDCIRFPQLWEFLRTVQLVVRDMNQDELRRAIEEPARRAGVPMEPGLADLLLDDVSGSPSPLPLLQYALRELWDRPRDRMTVQAYRNLGRVTGVLQKKAEEVFSRFTPAEQEICKSVFLRLIQRVDGARYTRYRATFQELFTAKYSAEMVRPVLFKLADEKVRLLTLGGGDQKNPGGQPFVEIAHEALIGSWDRLDAWLKENEEFHLWRRRLQSEIEEWEHYGRDRSVLLRGSLLAEAQKWRRERLQDLNEREQSFIEASAAFRRKEAIAKNVLAACSALALVVGGAFVITLNEDQSRKLANEATSLLVRGNESKAISLALQAVKRSRTQDAIEALQETVQYLRRPALESDGSPIQALAWSPDARLMATGSKNGAAVVWDADTDNERARLASSNDAAVLSVAFSPDSRLLAIVGTDKSLRLWNFQSAGPPQIFGTANNVLTRVAFAQDGRRIFASSLDGTVNMWDLAAGTRSPSPVIVAGAAIRALALSPDGKTIATGQVDGRVRLWNAETHGQQSDLEEHREEHHDSVTDLAFSSDGKFLASASNDGTCQVWSVDKRTRQLIVTGDKPAGLAAVAFSPDGDRFLTAGLSGLAKLWNTRSGRQVLALRGRTETQLTAAVFPPVVQTGGHKQVAIAAANGTVRVYELNEKLLTNDARDLLANYQKH